MGRYAYLEGRFVPLEDAKISVQTHAFMYGTACFEGIRAYWNADDQQMYVFRMTEHYQRLLNSCKILRIQLPYTVEDLNRISVELLRKNGDRQDMYLRPIAYKSGPQIGPILVGIPDDFLLFAIPMGAYLDVSKGLKVCVSSWTHLSDNMIPMRAKVNGAYVNAALARTEAADNGCDEAIFLTRDGKVSEGTAENLFLVRHGQLITPPVTADILEGVTRSTIIELARDELGLPVVEREVDRTELYVADEAFFVGTGAQVSPIAEIDRRPVGDGGIGPITRQLQKLYFDVVRGKVEKYRHWCTPVF
ncbi:MAG TPA: branched-chain amino acid transaminase [Limnochordales bacterium]|nr:branched-chain amino acid transaminase [Limnochordales bacterium]